MANGMTSKQKKEWAKLLYIKEDMLFKDIASKLEVNRATIGRWAKDGKWESTKNANSASRETALYEATQQLSRINKSIKDRDGIPTSREADTISKLRKTIKECSKGITASDAMDFGAALLKWIKQQHPEKAVEISFLIEDYVQTLL